MRDYDASLRVQRRNLPQFGRDILVRKPVEAVAPHALIVIFARHGEHVIDEGMAAMEGGVETGNLWHVRPSLARRFDAGDVVQLVQRRKGNERLKLSDDVVSDDHRRVVMNAAMHDAVTGGNHVGVREGAAPPGEYAAKRVGMERSPRHLRPGIGKRHRAETVAHIHSTLLPNHFGKADGERRDFVSVDFKQRESHARSGPTLATATSTTWRKRSGRRPGR
jgi:hypothetical protein